MLALYKVLKFIFRYLVPGPLRYPFVRLIARGVIRFNRARREVLIGNLTPLVGKEKARALAPVVMGNFLMTAVDFFCASRTLPQEVQTENWSLLTRTYEKTKRVVMVTAHLGHWELGISCLVEKGYPVTGVYATYTDDAIVNWILSHRNPKVEWIPTHPGAAESCVAAIEKGRVLGMVADIPYGEEGRRVQIAGRWTRLPIGPWVIAVRAKATIIPAFIIRTGPGTYRAILHEPIRPGKGSLGTQIAEMQRLYAQYLESYLRTYPQQWGVLAPFWN